jgi:hypothetical protein
MALVDLVHPEVICRIGVEPLLTKCRRFVANPQLSREPYRVQSAVRADAFQTFITALEGHVVDVTEGNYTGLLLLCEEFGFDGLTPQLAMFDPSAGPGDANSRRRILVLEEHWQVSERQIAELQSQLSRQTAIQDETIVLLRRFEAEIARLSAAVEAQSALAARVDRAEEDIAGLRGAVGGKVELSAAVEAGAALPPRVDQAELARVASEVGEVRAALLDLKRWMAPRLDSLIVKDFPPLFDDLGARHFNLLWRGSRDSFSADEFHHRCDGHANTLTLIADTGGNIFGGFTPVEWESESGFTVKGDDSQASFLFTLKNPSGIPPQKFPLLEDRKHDAISCGVGSGPAFGRGSDISVSDDCNANDTSCTCFGAGYRKRQTYANNINVKDFFTGSKHFRVKEIEVFEISD